MQSLLGEGKVQSPQGMVTPKGRGKCSPTDLVPNEARRKLTRWRGTGCLTSLVPYYRKLRTCPPSCYNHLVEIPDRNTFSLCPSSRRAPMTVRM